MSSLELYLPPNSESSYTCFFTIIAIIMFAGWTQMKIEKISLVAEDIERYRIAFEKRISELEYLFPSLSNKKEKPPV